MDYEITNPITIDVLIYKSNAGHIMRRKCEDPLLELQRISQPEFFTTNNSGIALGMRQQEVGAML